MDMIGKKTLYNPHPAIPFPILCLRSRQVSERDIYGEVRDREKVTGAM
jgi:hypothetical protein